MSKYNLHVTSVPDHKAQMVLARIIVGSDSLIPIQQAMEMASTPPLLLFQNLERKDLKPHIEHLTSLGVKFSLSEVQEVLDVPGENFFGHKKAQEPEQPPAAPRPRDTAAIEDNAPPAPQPAKPAAPPTEPEPPKPPAQLRQPEKSTPAAREPVHAAEHEYHKYQSGRRASAFDDAAALNDAEAASRKKSFAVTFVIVAVLLLAGVIIVNLPKGNKINVERTPELIKNKPEKNAEPAKTKPAAKAPDSSAGTPAVKHGGEPRVQPTPQQKQQSDALVDSAGADGSDLKKNVAFYKMAISFNRQNLAAWQGLLQAYRELHLDAEAHAAERQMNEIFGSEALSVVNTVKSYGEVIDIYVRNDNAHSVEYKTAKTSKVDILRDVFALTRALRASCACQNISVYAATGPGKGVTVHSTQSTSVHSLSEFMRQAEIVWLE